MGAVDYRNYRLRFAELLKVFLIGTAASGIIAWLFYSSVVMGFILMAPSEIIVLRLYKRSRIKKRKERLALEFEEMLQCLATALSVGYSLENAFAEAKEELSSMYADTSCIVVELNRICSSISLNKTPEELVMDFAVRSGIEDIYVFAEILAIAKRSGGDLISIVRQAADMLHNKKEISEDIRTMITAKQLESRIMCIMPIAMLIYLDICSPEYLSVMYGNIDGAAIMTICLFIYVLAVYFSGRIVSIEAEIKCKRPELKSSRRNNNGCLLRLSARLGRMSGVNAKITRVYIEKSGTDVKKLFWSRITAIVYLGAVVCITLFLYGILVDRDNLWYMIFAGIALAAGLPMSRIKQLDKLMKERDKQLMLDYPELVNKFTLLLGSGINMRGAWRRMSEEYLVKRKENEIAMHYLYEEMYITCCEIVNGVPERAAYERFGRRIGLLPYMKFCTMLVQNLKKGNRSLLDQLRLTSLDALEHRRDAMKRLGEEASSKLLLPMMLQFAVILVIVMYPALAVI